MRPASTFSIIQLSNSRALDKESLLYYNEFWENPCKMQELYEKYVRERKKL